LHCHPYLWVRQFNFPPSAFFPPHRALILVEGPMNVKRRRLPASSAAK
jgi:hypothetical protein